jgi:hypothetical protein
MKERPILFNGEMVRAILEGRKTQTRRVVQHPTIGSVARVNSYRGSSAFDLIMSNDEGTVIPCPYGKPGDRLWVRETFCQKLDDDDMFVYNADGNLDASCCYYRADLIDVDFPAGGGWSPSIHMPRWASRITLEITGVRVERLNEISDDDAFAEGVLPNWAGPRSGFSIKNPAPSGAAFADLWESINGPGSWAANPWVWVVEFRRVEQ